MPICKLCGPSKITTVSGYTPESFTICKETECLDPVKCSEIIDAACIQYTGENLTLCETSYVIISKYDYLEDILSNIISVLCNPCNIQVSFIASESMPNLTALASGGTAPYTYEWGFAQGNFVGHTILGPINTNTLNLLGIGTHGIETDTFNTFIKLSMMYVDVTDSAGCISRHYYTYTSDCYQQIVTPPTFTQGAYGKLTVQNESQFGTFWRMGGFDFMDDITKMPTCEELKNICCSVEGMDWGDAAGKYRADRDAFLEALNENMLAENVGFPEPYFHSVADDSQWAVGGLADQIAFEKGGENLYNIPLGCAECYRKAWKELHYDVLGGKTLAEYLPTVNAKFIWLPAITNPLAPLPTGQPGQLIKRNDPNDPGTYLELAWDPNKKKWSEILMGPLEDFMTTNRERRNANLKAFNELTLALRPFIWANEYLPFHRLKYTTNLGQNIIE